MSIPRPTFHRNMATGHTLTSRQRSDLLLAQTLLSAQMAQHVLSEGPLKVHAQVIDELSVHKGLLLRGSRLVVTRHSVQRFYRNCTLATSAQQNAMKEPSSQCGGQAYARNSTTLSATPQYAVNVDYNMQNHYLRQNGWNECLNGRSQSTSW